MITLSFLLLELSAFILFFYFLSALNLKYPSEILMVFGRNVGPDDVLRTRKTTLPLLLFALSPFLLYMTVIIH